MLNDVLHKLANLSKLLQRSALSPIKAHQLCIFKVCKLEAQYLVNNNFWNNKAKQSLTENEGKDKRQITWFVRSVCDHVYARFPPDELK